MREAIHNKWSIKAWFLVTGILVSVLCAMLCNAVLNYFETGSGYHKDLDQFLSADTLDSLVENNLVLYKDLVNSQTAGELDYAALYIQPKGNYAWILNENNRRIFKMSSDDEWDQLLIQSQIPEDAGRVYSYIDEMLRYFTDCEEKFPAIAETYGYSCEDLVTGKRINNLGASSGASGQYIRISFVYDEFGNCSVEAADYGENSEALNRCASQTARDFSLAEKTSYKTYDEEAFLPLSEYFTLKSPVNCRFTYSISAADWKNRRPFTAFEMIFENKERFIACFLFFLFLWYFFSHSKQIKEHFKKTYDTFTHFDVTRKAHKIILKLVLINGVILFLISILWTGRFAFAIVYSLLLYIVLRKYISDLQKKFGILLGAINEIAQGHLDVEIKEELGVFEPFKPQIYRIQKGFRNAVDEEVKSQRMKTELITNVSHDLKTPLTAIITYINLLKDESITPEQRKEYLDTLERKSLRLKDLIEDLFEVSRANSKNMKLNLTEVDLISLIKQAAFEVDDKLRNNHLDLRMNLPEGKIFLKLDPQRTYRIYENLFVNITKYAMPGTRVYVNAAVTDDQVFVILKNIAAQEIHVEATELTERFVRGDSSRNTEGSGLGLAIAKSFANLQNGDLKIEVDGDLFKVTTIWSRINI